MKAQRKQKKSFVNIVVVFEEKGLYATFSSWHIDTWTHRSHGCLFAAVRSQEEHEIFEHELNEYFCTRITDLLAYGLLLLSGQTLWDYKPSVVFYFSEKKSIKKVNGYLLDAIIICTFATNKDRYKSHLMTKKVPSAMEQADWTAKKNEKTFINRINRYDWKQTEQLKKQHCIKPTKLKKT